ncbi:hypothetical protein E2K93_00445 [Thalassotalea sp. HSM 43]|uniref:hypothetical protein n=1 Tax=Thalassotalea sp. HSM 43 TaxID=2552945 RepID=UPI0010808C05|nr:hypothetical protein [Thalassotalea sp. HSM 43]QBY02931.1 hypothetical protein E2K93_00445 [Thalassotalea sp. HSM 43]
MKQFLGAISTPLASIFGSGFLVIVPILAGAVAFYSVYAMLAVCVLAFLVGEVIRYNIQYVEPCLANKVAAKSTLLLQRVSDLALILAYVISVCLYLHILSAFVLTAIDYDTPINEDILTTVIIITITLIGLIKGLKPLENIETWALLITLLVIIILSVALANYDYAIWQRQSSFTMPVWVEQSSWQILTILAGTLIVVQGFETSRYLGREYAAKLRIKTSRWSQIISTLVYLSFVTLALPVVHTLDGQYNDHSLIDLIATVSVLLVTPLVLAAALSQFSAAVADTLAASGSMVEMSKGVLTYAQGYLLVGVGAIVLTWSVNTFEVIALASRSFALYYFIQCLVAISVAKNRYWQFVLAILSVILLWITLFAKPVG